MAFNIMCIASLLLSAVNPVIGDTRNMKTPIIVAVIAVVLIVVCLLLSRKPKDNNK